MKHLQKYQYQFNFIFILSLNSLQRINDSYLANFQSTTKTRCQSNYIVRNKQQLFDLFWKDRNTNSFSKIVPPYQHSIPLIEQCNPDIMLSHLAFCQKPLKLLGKLRLISYFQNELITPRRLTLWQYKVVIHWSYFENNLIIWIWNKIREKNIRRGKRFNIKIWLQWGYKHQIGKGLGPFLVEIIFFIFL